MFASTVNGVTQVNCAVQPDSDVSGIGVRSAFYFQALFAILLNLFAKSPSDIYLIDVSLLISSITFIAGTLFDSSIDVVHALIAGHFAVMLAEARTPSFIWPVAVLVKRGGKTALLRMEAVEAVFRLILAIFNILLWSNLRAIQTQNECPNGAGDWVFFGGVNPVGASTTASIAVFKLVILMGIWQIVGAVATVARLWMWNHENTLLRDIARGSQFLPVLWWMAKLCRTEPILVPRRIRWVIFIGTRFFQLAIVGYGIINVEHTVAVNGIESSENEWGIGQIAAMVNLLGTAGLMSYRLLRSFVLLSSPNMYDVAESADSLVNENDGLFSFLGMVLTVVEIILVALSLDRWFPQNLSNLSPASFLGWVALWLVGILYSAAIIVAFFLNLVALYSISQGALLLRSTKNSKFFLICRVLPGKW
jgi:hypothetical protein